MKLILDVLLSAATIYQVFASPVVLSAAAMVCSHCCQQTVSFLTVFFFFMFSGGPIWLYLFVVPDFGATHVTPSIVGCGGGGGPIWPCMSVVLDFSAMHSTSLYCGLQGGLFGHVHVCNLCLLWVVGPTWPCMSGTRLWCHARKLHYVGLEVSMKVFFFFLSSHFFTSHIIFIYSYLFLICAGKFSDHHVICILL